MSSVFSKVAGVSLGVVRGPGLDTVYWDMERSDFEPRVLRPGSTLLYPSGSASHTAPPSAAHSSQTSKDSGVDQGAHHGEDCDLDSGQGLLPSPSPPPPPPKEMPPRSYISQCIFRAADGGPGPSKDYCAFSITTFIMLSDINTALGLICLT